MARNNRYTVCEFIVSVLVFFLCYACGDLNQQQSQKVNQALADSLTSTTQTWGVDMKLIEHGQKKVRLRGSYAASFNNEKVNETRIKGPIYIQVFDTTNAIKTWVHSDSAIYHSEESRFELFGNVRVRTRSKRHLESEYLNWDQADNTISTPQFVIITTPSDSIAGTGFKGASDLSKYTIKNPSGRVIFE